MSESKELSRDDLFLLMQSYKNTVESNTILLEQQKLLLDQHNEIIRKEADLLNIVYKVLEKCEGLPDLKTDLENKITTCHSESTKERSDLKTNTIYIIAGMSSVVLSLIGLVVIIWSKLDIIEKIAKHLGVLL